MRTPDETPDRSRIDAVLAQVDAALEGRRVTVDDPEGRELQELALAVAAESPAPDPEFAERLERRVTAGFPGRKRPFGSGASSAVRGFARRTGRLRAGRRPAAGRSRPWRPSLPLLAGAASVPLVLLAAISLSGGGGGPTATDLAPRTEAPQGGGGKALPETPGTGREALQPDSTIAPSPVPPPPGDGGIAPGVRDRRIERSASLTLAAPEDRMDGVADGIVAVADRRRGFVLRSLLATGDGGTTGGHFELRVPARDLQATLRDLSTLATVRARTQSGEDVTRTFVTATDRLAGARAERQGILRRLERARSTTAAQALRQRLNLVSAEINGLRAHLRALRERTTYASVIVTLVEDGDEGAGAGGDTRRALDDALDSLVGSFNLALRILGVAIPLLVVLALGRLGFGVVRRRRREAVLS